VDQPETLIEPETAVEEALAHVAERVVRLVSTPKIEEQSRFNLLEMLSLYDFGIARMRPMHHERWRTCFALAASTGGVWSASEDGRTTFLGIFWRTNNINVNLAREVPPPTMDGIYAYVGFQWNDGRDGSLTGRFKRHMIRSCEGAQFIAWHDNRAKLRKKSRGRPWVLKIQPEQAQALRERN